MPDYTLGNLKADLRLNLFPTGEADNLVAPHNQMFVAGLTDIQRAVECLQINNVEIIPQCDTLFRSGLTVFDKPSGRPHKLYVIDRINQTTGLEDATQPPDWSSAVIYRQCRYEDLMTFISSSMASNANFNGFLSWFGQVFGTNPIPFIALPGFWFAKWVYPPPTDAGLATAPPLPIGYHYAQQSTDAQGGVRSQFGMWAVKGGQIFVAPWIQSTETIVLEWDGKKSSWQDTDLVHQGPTFKLAVENYVRWQHELYYGRDPVLRDDSEKAYARAIQEMMYDCRQENEIRETNDPANMLARGSGYNIPTFSNTPQNATANCPTGQTGTAVTVTIPAGQVTSTVSLDDANSRAKSLALQQAAAQLNCVTPPISYSNNAQTGTATCTNAQGSTVNASATVPAGQYTSTVSQADADSQALTTANAQAQGQLSGCVFVNFAQTATGSCPNSPSTTTTQTVQAGIYQSSLSQADANQQALTAAQNLVAAWLNTNCPAGGGGPPPIFHNTAQTATVTYHCKIFNPFTGFTIVPITVSVTIAANTVSSNASQATANQQALGLATARANQQAVAECHVQGGT
jgi:hypothetical protein